MVSATVYAFIVLSLLWFMITMLWLIFSNHWDDVVDITIGNMTVFNPFEGSRLFRSY